MLEMEVDFFGLRRVMTTGAHPDFIRTIAPRPQDRRVPEANGPTNPPVSEVGPAGFEPATKGL